MWFGSFGTPVTRRSWADIVDEEQCLEHHYAPLFAKKSSASIGAAGGEGCYWGGKHGCRAAVIYYRGDSSTVADNAQMA